jgi:hypothetical protein
MHLVLTSVICRVYAGLVFRFKAWRCGGMTRFQHLHCAFNAVAAPAMRTQPPAASLQLVGKGWQRMLVDLSDGRCLG